MSGVKGWCPGALRPMEAGDGWVVRVRPHGGRLSQAQAEGLARAARTHGNGLIDLTGRANLQLRGVRAESHVTLIGELRHLGLTDPDIATETRRNIIVTPFADAGTDAIAAELENALACSDLTLPAKFGFAVDAGPVPVMADIPADIRIERGADGQLILRADGMGTGQPLTAMSQVVELAHWFLAMGGADGGKGRMARLIATGVMPEASHPPVSALPVSAPAPAPVPAPGLVAQGLLAAVEFGQSDAAMLSALARLGPIRMTPWQMVLVEGVTTPPDLPGIILDAADPRLRLRACTGAPGCPQAHAPTRPLARQLAPHVPPGTILHVSGCAKGCGWPRAALACLTATPDGFDLIRGGRASDIPQLRGISAARLPEVL